MRPLLLALSLAASAPSSALACGSGWPTQQVSPSEEPLVFFDETPTTLLPLYARTPADERAQELVFTPLFFFGAIS